MILNDFQWLNLVHVQTLCTHHGSHNGNTWRQEPLTCLCLCDELLPTWDRYCLKTATAATGTEAEVTAEVTWDALR